MDVLVVGASGRTGRLLTSGAFERAPRSSAISPVAFAWSRATCSLPGGRRVARTDIAEYMLDQLTLTGDTGRAAAVAY